MTQNINYDDVIEQTFRWNLEKLTFKEKEKKKKL